MIPITERWLLRYVLADSQSNRWNLQAADLVCETRTEPAFTMVTRYKILNPSISAVDQKTWFIRIFRVQQYCGCYTSIYSQDDCVFLRSKMEDSRLDRVLFGPFLYDSWSKGRRALIPKGELSFRSATQLDPWDSLILTALIREFGDAIERKRIPYREGIVFSYRFEPTQNGEMYQREADWPSFWEQSIKKAASISGYVAIADISSYYNQIYHPVLEEHLRQAGVPEKAVEALVRLCDTVTPGASRGIPVGPHASHLLAECVFDLIDRNLQAKGYIFCRFVDDIHIFCKTREQAHMAFYDLVNIISGLELNLQNHKSDILSKDEFIEKAKHVLIEAPQPVGDLEKGIIAVIDRHSNGDRYRSIDYSHLTKEDLAVLSQPNLEAVLRSHLTQNEPDFIRIRWLFRRLAQVGVPGAVPIAIEKLEQFSPAVDALASYLLSARNNYSPDGWKHVGKEILHTLDLPIIQHSEYLTVILLDLFARLPALNHIDNILQKYDTSSSLMEKRKIIRIATVYPAADWLDQIIERPSLNDAWLRRAFIAGASAFSSRNERNHWLDRFKTEETKLDAFIARWAKSQHLSN